MKVSLSTIKRYTNVDMTIDELVGKINRQLGKVETVVDMRGRYDGAVVVRVDSCEKHPNADKLNICMVDDGSRELTQVVCGAPNVTAGMYAVWLKPGSTVPASADDAEPFVLGARELRGVMSNGMLASPKELAIGDGHDGILEITEYDLPDTKSLTPGASFAELFEMDDTIIDIENKMFTHRPDLFGQLGVAREIAGISGNEFVSPRWYVDSPTGESGGGLELTTFNDTEGAVPRIMFLPMSDVTIQPSPLWLQCALVALGSKPINNVVDATNYTMLLTAQPTHAYDYDKLRGKSLGARMAHEGETVTLLNGKNYSLNGTDIVIADAEGPVGIGGIMGGRDSEVSESTKNIVLEVATFDMYAVRKSSMRHGIFTDALTRFNKGQSPLQNAVILSRLSEMVRMLSGAKPAADVVDLHDESIKQVGVYGEHGLVITPDFINARLGLKLTGDDIAQLLTNVEFKTDRDAATESLRIYVPFWRTDIELPEDIVEEVGRLYGFDALPRVLPERSMKPASVNLLRDIKQRLRVSLSRAGANELLTYSFVHGKLLENTGYAPEDSFKLSNAVSPELQYYRPRVLPSLLDKVRPNIKKGYDEFALFEIGKGHDKTLEPTDEGLPRETQLLDIVYASKRPQDGAAFYRVRRLLDAVAEDMGTSFVYSTDLPAKDVQLFDTDRAARVIDEQSGETVGSIGEFSADVSKKFKLPDYAAGAMLDIEALLKVSSRAALSYQPLSRYPTIAQDVSIKVSAETSYNDVLLAVKEAAAKFQELNIRTAPLTIYAPQDDASTRTVTLRLTVASYERTLSDNDVKPIIEAVAEHAKQHFDGLIV